MTSFTAQEKLTIAHLSALFFNKEEIEIFMSKEEEKSFEQLQVKGILQGEYEIRKTLYQNAKDGDTKAIDKWMILKSYLNR